MSAVSRNKAIKRGQKALDSFNPEEGDFEILLNTLKDVASEVVEDLQDQRDNLDGGLLDNWEESHGYKSDQWETTESELENLLAEISEDGYEEATQDTYDTIVEHWDSAVNQ